LDKRTVGCSWPLRYRRLGAACIMAGILTTSVLVSGCRPGPAEIDSHRAALREVYPDWVEVKSTSWISIASSSGSGIAFLMKRSGAPDIYTTVEFSDYASGPSGMVPNYFQGPIDPTRQALVAAYNARHPDEVPTSLTAEAMSPYTGDPADDEYRVTGMPVRRWNTRGDWRADRTGEWTSRVEIWQLAGSPDAPVWTFVMAEQGD
jgi:hypothetical protein